MWVRFRSVKTVAGLSLKNHVYAVIPVPIEVSLNCTVKGAVPLRGLPVKSVTGATNGSSYHANFKDELE